MDGYKCKLKDWKEVEVTLDSSATQTITFSIGCVLIHYTRLSQIRQLLSQTITLRQPLKTASAVNINIPTSITAPAGGFDENGQITHELMITNKDFSVPQISILTVLRMK